MEPAKGLVDLCTELCEDPIMMTTICFPFCLKGRFYELQTILNIYNSSARCPFTRELFEFWDFYEAPACIWRLCEEVRKVSPPTSNYDALKKIYANYLWDTGQLLRAAEQGSVKAMLQVANKKGLGWMEWARRAMHVNGSLMVAVHYVAEGDKDLAHAELMQIWTNAPHRRNVAAYYLAVNCFRHGLLRKAKKWAGRSDLNCAKLLLAQLLFNANREANCGVIIDLIATNNEPDAEYVIALLMTYGCGIYKNKFHVRRQGYLRIRNLAASGHRSSFERLRNYAAGFKVAHVMQPLPDPTIGLE